MRVVHYCVAAAATGVLCVLAATVGARLELTLVAAQAWVNLLGWGSIGLCGLYFCSPGPALRPRLAWTLAIVASLGFLAMSGGLAALSATGDPRFAALAVAGAPLAVFGPVIFATELLAGRRGSRPSSRAS